MYAKRAQELTLYAHFLLLGVIYSIMRQNRIACTGMNEKVDPHSTPDSTSLTVVFLLQPHFSLLAFTAAADALTTANLVIGEKRFKFRTVSIDNEKVISDLGIPISSDEAIPGLSLTDIPQAEPHVTHSVLKSADMLIVCGGYRCDLEEHPATSELLRLAHEQQIMLGGLWNGIFSVAWAGLMEGYACALHPDNQSLAIEQFPDMFVRQDSVVIDRVRASAAGPNSAFDLMLLLIQRHDTIETVQAIRNILRADAGSAENVETAIQRDDESRFPVNLRNALQLMRSNLDEPVDKHVIAQHMNMSTRAMERIFRRYLNTSPARHYMQLRLQSAYELLQQTDQSISEVSDACGFVSSAHFSRTFNQKYGFAPSALRKSVNRVIDV